MSTGIVIERTGAGLRLAALPTQVLRRDPVFGREATRVCPSEARSSRERTGRLRSNGTSPEIALKTRWSATDGTWTWSSDCGARSLLVSPRGLA